MVNEYPDYLAKLFNTEVLSNNLQTLEVSLKSKNNNVTHVSFVSIYDMNLLGFRAINGFNVISKHGDIAIERDGCAYPNKWILPLKYGNSLVYAGHIWEGSSGAFLNADHIYIFRHAWSPYAHELYKLGSNSTFEEFWKKYGKFKHSGREPSVGNVIFSTPSPLP